MATIGLNKIPTNVDEVSSYGRGPDRGVRTRHRSDHRGGIDYIDATYFKTIAGDMVHATFTRPTGRVAAIVAITKEQWTEIGRLFEKS